jgi:hypothetical protein
MRTEASFVEIACECITKPLLSMCHAEAFLICHSVKFLWLSFRSAAKESAVLHTGDKMSLQALDVTPKRIQALKARPIPAGGNAPGTTPQKNQSVKARPIDATTNNGHTFIL